MSTQDIDGELRLFLEEVCCELCRLHHVVDEGMAPHDIHIAREVPLGSRTAFADIVVNLPNAPAYFVEIKYGLSLDNTVRSIHSKFAVNHLPTCNRLVIVVRDLDAETLKSRLRDCVCSSLDIEVWDEARMLGDISKRLGVKIDRLTDRNILELHRSILHANWNHIFEHDFYETQASALLWHFSPWTLSRLYNQDKERYSPTTIWDVRNYPEVAIVMADISSFSAYVRDTRDQNVMQQVLTAFYSQTRHVVHEYDGMLYQFVGDEVIGLFGFPDRKPGYITDAFNCAKALLDIGASTSEHWQRRIDNVQDKHGVHVGVAIGALNLLPLRPFARSHIGFIGEALNMAARLMAIAKPSEIVVSNTFFQELSEELQAEFERNKPIKAKNVGVLQSWRRPAVL